LSAADREKAEKLQPGTMGRLRRATTRRTGCTFCEASIAKATIYPRAVKRTTESKSEVLY